MAENLQGENDESPSAPRTDHNEQEADRRAQEGGLNPASSIPPEHMTLAAIVAGSSGSIGQGIATAGALDMAQGEAEYQRRWAKRVRESHGWQKLWRIIWG